MFDRSGSQGAVGAERGGVVADHTGAVDVDSHGGHEVCGGGSDAR